MDASPEYERRLQSFDLVFSDISCGDDFSLVDGSLLNDGQSFSSAVKNAAALLSYDQCLIASADNPLGLQYLLGYRDNEGLLPFSTFANDDNGRRIDYQGLMSLKKELEDTGFSVFCYYPFPNRKNCTLLYSQSVLPGERDLKAKYSWIDEKYHIFAFDDYGVIDRIVSNGLFPQFSSSYILLIRKRSKIEKNHVIYSKYSLSRDERFALRTVIEEEPDGKRKVYKRPCIEKGKEQLSFIKKSFEILSKKSENTPLSINSLSGGENELHFEYVSGRTFSSELSELMQKSEEKVTALFEALFEYKDMVESIYKEKEPFKIEEGYKNFFGDTLPDEELMSVRGLDIDLIFENLLRGEDKKWTVIDYEWTFAFLIPIKYLYYRASLFFTLGRLDPASDSGLLKKLFSFFEISREEERLFAAMEECFQKTVAGDEKGLPLTFDGQNYTFSDIISGRLTPEHFQIFYGRGTYYSEADSKVIYLRNNGEAFSLDIDIEDNVSTLRLDPGELPVILGIKKSFFLYDDGTMESVFPRSSGRELPGGLFLMDDDPQLYLNVPPGAVSYHIEFFFDRQKSGMIHELFKKDDLWDRKGREESADQASLPLQ